MEELMRCLDAVATNMNRELVALLQNEDRLRAVAKTAFDQVDADHSGFIDRSELETVMNRVAKNLHMTTPTAAEIDTLMREIDTNADGQVSFNEYVELVRRILRKVTGQTAPEASPDSAPQEEGKNEEVLRQVRMFERYLEDTGLTKAFQIIFAEIISKKIEPANVFAYCAMRLRQIGKEIAHLLPKNLTANLAESSDPAPS